MHQAKETATRRRPGRLRRVRALYRNVSKRRTAWLLVKDTVNSCMEYRILGLAAEAAFFTLLSVPPLLLCLVGLLGYVDAWTGADTIAGFEQHFLDASRAVLSDQGVHDIAEPIFEDVTRGRPDVISIGFVFALWSGSRAVNVFIDTITVMYGLDGVRGIVATRLLSFGLFIVGLLVCSVALPLMVAGPDTVVHLLPWSGLAVQILYWPVVIILCVVFLTTLYHVSVPVRSPWIEDVPGSFVALAMWFVCSFALRIYLTSTIEGPTIYGSLAAPVAVLLWIGVSAFAVLVGAAMNAAIDRVWPSVATSAAREANERAREAEAVGAMARYAAERAGHGEPGDPDMPSEYPERWAGFLPPEDVSSRLRAHVKRRPGKHAKRADSGAGTGTGQGGASPAAPPGADPTQAPPGEPPYESERPYEGEPPYKGEHGYASGGGQHRGTGWHEGDGGGWPHGG
ncbi:MULTISPECIES: YihY/virulence factor BrkB family protein [unclassified Streptomyces]|uniref:YhjD/YihY/BrkB family envelope integrity protein n=2 Tax=Streptomyces TaxID=1883 RepID=A0ABU2R7B4_9ACTN|nr:MULTISPECIES: YihY/virulence factor BrkB family protein [unclassified Streptomyces]MDT0412510.1 YhjD/YihY/BrkB family envelope integrity protein [Streptomyces sp. DSM 41979]